MGLVSSGCPGSASDLWHGCGCSGRCYGCRVVEGQSSSGENVVRPQVVYVGWEMVSGLMVSMVKGIRVEYCGGQPGCWRKVVPRDRCDIVPGGQAVREQIGANVELGRCCPPGGPLASCHVGIGRVCCRLCHLGSMFGSAWVLCGVGGAGCVGQSGKGCRASS